MADDSQAVNTERTGEFCNSRVLTESTEWYCHKYQGHTGEHAGTAQTADGRWVDLWWRGI